MRYQTGTVIVDRRNRIVATGYIGPAAGLDRSIGAGVEECSTFCFRGLNGPSEATRLSYSDCDSIHSELNALLVCDRRDREGGTLYVTSIPCWTCAKAIANSGVARVVVVDTSEQHAYRDPGASFAYLRDCGLTVDVVQPAELPHDHDRQFQHLVDEWGTRGVALKLLEPLDEVAALGLLEVLRRDLTKEVEGEQDPPQPLEQRADPA